MTQQGKELAIYQGQGAIAALTPEDITDQIQLIQQVMKANMQEGVHYGVIPGTSGKPTLLKAGGEKLQLLFRLNASFDTQITDMGKGHREYRVTCTLNRLDGSLAGQGVGSCSTLERKFRYRGKGEARYENPDLPDVYNTVLKMAKKRAHVDAIITATACSDIFTQDLEDMDIGHETGAGQGVTIKVQSQAATPAPETRSQGGQGGTLGGEETVTQIEVPGRFWTLKKGDGGVKEAFAYLTKEFPELAGKKLGTVKGKDGKWYVAVKGDYQPAAKKASTFDDDDIPFGNGTDNIVDLESI